MMKLSTMKKVVDTVNSEWRSPLAEEILERWGFDEGSVYYYRSSANFLFVFKKDGKRRFLRFNDSSERDLESIESEINVLLYLQDQPIKVAKPVQSNNEKYIEVIAAEKGTFYAVVFESLEGKQFDTDELDFNQFYQWGHALGELHKALDGMPEEYVTSRQSWKDHLEFVRNSLPQQEIVAVKELEVIMERVKALKVSNQNYGLIHYDFELDNLCWNQSAVSILDFDDCCRHWYVADIAYALRDILEDGVNWGNPSLQQFLNGYEQRMELDKEILNELPWFIRMHKLVTFAKLLRTVDLEESPDYPEWLSGLRKKLLDKLDDYRDSFKK